MSQVPKNQSAKKNKTATETTKTLEGTKKSLKEDRQSKTSTRATETTIETTKQLKQDRQHKTAIRAQKKKTNTH